MDEVNLADLDIERLMTAIRLNIASYKEKIKRLEVVLAGLGEILEEEYGPSAPLAPYAGVALAVAASLALADAGGEMTTPDLWKAMRKGGSTSSAKNPVNTLYTVLRREPDRFKRVANVWRLLKPPPRPDPELGF